MLLGVHVLSVSQSESVSIHCARHTVGHFILEAYHLQEFGEKILELPL
jgi:hypothetical protein